MRTRTIIKHALGTLALLSAANSQAALVGYTDAGAFATDLASLGFAVETRTEGFEPTVAGVPTPWVSAVSPSISPEVTNLGVRWYHTNTTNPGFTTTDQGGDAQQGTFRMSLPGLLTIQGTTMSYAVETGGFNLVAFGGWFKDSNGGAKPVFTLNDGRTYSAGPLGMDWEFRGFIDDDPNGGFNQVFVTETETNPGDELESFITDGVTLAALPGLLPPAPVPLPAALPLFGSALLGLGFIGRRRQKKLS